MKTIGVLIIGIVLYFLFIKDKKTPPSPTSTVNEIMSPVKTIIPPTVCAITGEFNSGRIACCDPWANVTASGTCVQT